MDTARIDGVDERHLDRARIEIESNLRANSSNPLEYGFELGCHRNIDSCFHLSPSRRVGATKMGDRGWIRMICLGIRGEQHAKQYLGHIFV